MLLCHLQVLPPVARLFTPAVSCPTCSYPNDHTFNYCQRCGYVRRRGNPPKRKALSLDLPAIDNRIQVLQQRNLSSAYSRQKQSLKEELENFLHALPGRKTLFDAIPFMSGVFLSTRMLWARHSPTAMDAPIPASEAYFLVIVLAVYPIIQSILTLGSCDPYFRTQAVKQIGTGRSIWVTHLLTSSLSFTSNRLLLNNFKLMLLRNRQLQSFQISYSNCYFLATWRSVSYCLISLLPKCLFSPVTKVSSNVYFTLGTVQEIWALPKPPRLPVFQMTVVFFLITFGGKPCAMHIWLLKSVRNASLSKSGPMPDSVC